MERAKFLEKSKYWGGPARSLAINNMGKKETTEITAVTQPQNTELQLAALFDHGQALLANQQWQKAEAIFAKIETHNSHYEQNGLRASVLRRKAKFERIATNALDTGELEAALIAFQKANDFEHAKEVHHLLTIQELEEKADQATAAGNYQGAAWVYDHLLNDYPENELAITWKIKRESCWEAELLPFFLLGTQALGKEQWRTAYQAFAQVLVLDPYFRKNGRSAAALSEIARKEVVFLADQILRQGNIQEAKDLYREVGHLARLETVDEFLRLRQREEETAVALEEEGKWQDAATKYSYLATLYYTDSERSQWHDAAIRCQTQHKLHTLYSQAMSACNQQQWRNAAMLFGKILELEPDFQPEEQSVKTLYRIARWRAIMAQFLSHTNNPPPQMNTGSLS